MAQSGFLGSNDTDGAAVDGSQRGNDVLAVTLVQLNSAVLVSQGGDGVSGGVLGGVQRSGRSAEVEQRRARQIVGGQQGGDRSSLLGGGNDIGGGHGGNACLGGECGGTGVGDLVLSVERGVQEQLSALGHDAQIGRSGVDGVGASAGAGDNSNLRHNTGNACDLSGQAGSGVQQFQATLQLGAGGVIERDDRGTGLGGHLQHADILFNILHADGGAVLKYNVDALAVCTAISGAYCTIGKQRRICAVIKKCCKDRGLAGFVCCHTASSLFVKTDCF